MKVLLVMRHAKSSWEDDSQNDHERPLNARGERDAPRMGRFLASKGLAPEVVLTSDAVRARQTTDAVIEAANWEVEPQVNNGLYLAEPLDMISTLSRIPVKVHCALLVGHNPGIAELVSGLVDEHTFMPTAAVAQIELPITRWQEVNMGLPNKLIARYYPRALPANFE